MAENPQFEYFTSSSSPSLSDTPSSSSSSEGEMMDFERLLFGSRHPVVNFLTDVVYKYSDIEFRNNFRVTRKTVQKLIEQYENSKFYKPKKCGGRKQISAEIQVLSFLWFAGNKETYRGMANLFGMSTSTAHKHLSNFLDFLLDISTMHVKFPDTEQEKNENAQAFTQFAGFQNTLGCIGCCFIFVRKPAGNIRSTYVNQHGLVSITVQGICDANKKFMDVCIGSPSKILDTRIFTLAFIMKMCDEKYHILGNAAYPISEFLLTPYKDTGTLTEQQIMFNKKHFQTQVQIDCAFHLLKRRFRQLEHLDFFDVNKMCKFILGCTVLHNFCIDESDIWLIDENDIITEECGPVTPAENTNLESLSARLFMHLGELKRNLITHIAV